MKLRSALLALAVVVVVSGVAVLGYRQDPADAKMVVAAQKFLAGLDDKQKAKATFAFDSKERTNWWFVPKQDGKKQSTRKGLPLEDMTADQKKAALDLLATGTSVKGNEQATTIMSLEAILREQEKKGAMVRNPEWYFFTVFGTPANKGKWGWRVEGHHLSLNFTLEDGVVLSATPNFFGANPAQVKSGPRKGERILPQIEDFAKNLFKSLDDDQRKIAYQEKPFPDTAKDQATVAPKHGSPVGLAAAKMNEKQRVLLVQLLEAYAGRMPPDVADRELKLVRAAGIDKVYFAYTGGTQPGQAYTYRVHGPSFVIEFLNEQADSAKNPANHIHSVWRRIEGDFGLKVK